MKADYILLDVFTNTRFGGNQLAIFPDADMIKENLMPKIAKELNISETVFLGPKNLDGSYPMRIFTPAMELPTAGHPTIGSAFYLASQENHDSDKISIHLEQKIGSIKVDVILANNQPMHATMYQPLPEFGMVYQERSQFASLLSLRENEFIDFPIQEISCGVPYVIIPIKTIESVRNIQFRIDVWDQILELVGGAFIYAFTPSAETPNAHLHGRMFAPEAGILEDPATGSANGPLGCYVHHYHIARGKLISEQGFEIGRPSYIHIEIKEEYDLINSVEIGGQSVFVGKGEMIID